MTDSPIENCARLRGRSACSRCSSRLTSSWRQRHRLVGRADEAGDAGRALHERPRVLVEVHVDEHVAGHRPLLDGDLLVVLHLRHGLGRDDDLPDRTLLSERHDAVLEVVLDLVLVTRVCVDDVPAEHFLSPQGYESRAPNLQALSLADRLLEDEVHELGGDADRPCRGRHRRRSRTRSRPRWPGSPGGDPATVPVAARASFPAGSASSRVKIPGLWAGACDPVAGHRTGAVGLGAVLRATGGRAGFGLIDLVLELLELLLVQRLRIRGVVERRLGLGQLRRRRRRGPAGRAPAAPRPGRRPAPRGESDAGTSSSGPAARSVALRRAAAAGRRGCATLLRAFTVASHGPAPVSSARLAVSGVAPAPAAVLAQLEPLRVVPLALVGLVVTALALFTSESRSDPDVSTGHLRASRCGVFRTWRPNCGRVDERRPGAEIPV